jgi:hypothetical protein
MTRVSFIVPCAAALIVSASFLVAPSRALAETAPPLPVFKNLPGVKPEDPLGSTSELKCEQVLVDRALGNIEPTRGPRYHTLNICRRDGGPEFSSPRLPPSNYRQLRGFNY